MQRFVASVFHSVNEWDHRHVVRCFCVGPPIRVSDIDVVLSHSDNILGGNHLCMRDRIRLAAHSVGDPGGFDAIQGCTHRLVTNRVDMNGESRQVHLFYVIHDHSAIVLELAAGDGALGGVVSMHVHEFLDVALATIYVGVLADILAKL